MGVPQFKGWGYLLSESLVDSVPGWGSGSLEGSRLGLEGGFVWALDSEAGYM